jgi:hypothetical protein
MMTIPTWRWHELTQPSVRERPLIERAEAAELRLAQLLALVDRFDLTVADEEALDEFLRVLPTTEEG